MRAWMQRCHVSVSVPESDATSVSVLESMACGLALAASASGRRGQPVTSPPADSPPVATLAAGTPSPDPGRPTWSVWPAPAKVNLFLRIVGRRPDGYHLLQSVFRILEWGDTLRLRARTDGRIVRHGGSVVGVAEADDLTVRAAKLLQLEANCTQGADIVVEKRIPAGGGLGGGSSDAATVLVALNHL